MKTNHNKFILVLLVLFLSACAPLNSSNTNSDELEVTKSSLLIAPESFVDNPSLLINPETFIADKKNQIIETAQTGPTINPRSDKYKAAIGSDRKEINKEERENYINVESDTQGGTIFSVSLNFENISIEDMAVIFSEVSGKNILIGDEVSGLVSAKLENVPWDKALDSILKIKNLSKYVDDDANIIRIHSEEVLLAQQSSDLALIVSMEATRKAKNSVEPLYTEIFKLYYTTAKQISTEIISIVNGASSAEGGEEASSGVEITIDERLNYLIVKAPKSDLDFIERLVGELDVRTKQILIEAFIVEASDDLGRALGANFGIMAPGMDNVLSMYQGDERSVDLIGDFRNTGTIGAGMTGNALGLILGTTTKNLSLSLRASETKGVTKILSNPRVFTLDGETAKISQVDQVPFTKIEEGQTIIELKDIGIVLDVTPVIVGDGNIILTVSVEKSTADTTATNPPIAKRTITTKLLIEDQTIVVIGGVFTSAVKESQSKTPFLGDLPFIGSLFKKDETTDVRKELLVFLAPRII